MEISPEYIGAGRIFLKAVLWDLGIFSDPAILQEKDWKYFLTHSKGIKVFLENGKDFFIDLQMPIERCIRVVADGLVNGVAPVFAHKVSDEELFKACVEAQAGFKMNKISIVDENDHILSEFTSIVDCKRQISVNAYELLEIKEKDASQRTRKLFFPQIDENKDVMESILALKGFDATSKGENTVTILIDGSYEYKAMLQAAAEKLNGMALRDEQNRLVGVKIQEIAR
jgi:hypothetical protein